ncbi:hypothetical protein RchiOBHm_Chr5g0029691 [Rosa chinensis]|uniref:Uncharacterized protein n=1 Tax=Rosa chinensis TaxID=74649 RepID=A0A2P6Q9P7_ROSCH|nr:hypothetical protein RchiOBHm_Chr5g0029691 [Rosa chinensis]
MIWSRFAKISNFPHSTMSYGVLVFRILQWKPLKFKTDSQLQAKPINGTWER